MFNPDRRPWVVGEADELIQSRLARMKRADFVFGHGPRACLGGHVAQLEIYKLIPTLFGLFDVLYLSPRVRLSYRVRLVFHMDRAKLS